MVIAELYFKVKDYLEDFDPNNRTFTQIDHRDYNQQLPLQGSLRAIFN
jgi:hypothetical protein